MIAEINGSGCWALACWWLLRWKGSFGVEHSAKHFCLGYSYYPCQRLQLGLRFLGTRSDWLTNNWFSFLSKCNSFPPIWPRLPARKKIQPSRRNTVVAQSEAKCISLSFLLPNSKMRLGWTHFPFHLGSSPWAGVKQLSFLDRPGIHLRNKPASVLNSPYNSQMLEFQGLRPVSVIAEHGQSLGPSQTVLSMDWMELTRCDGWALTSDMQGGKGIRPQERWWACYKKSHFLFPCKGHFLLHAPMSSWEKLTLSGKDTL